ncbi:MAG: PaaI family thioesterase [Nocardia sp.]|uniref:PaaI family thioesterase n=1 Tax=Nocardia sp. TaxID=1821 RepID=UPI0026202589|nr:PaaI family thioesterase [Nocardia sp.]MCU1642516.1 PaaI family thioesterase [Nocardia sp.]
MTITTEPAATSESWGELRSKTVYWHDPKVALEAAPGRTGLEYLTAMANGEIPGAPIGGLLGMRAVSASAGEIVFACTPDESMYNPIGLVHGGVACTLLDSAAGCAVHTTLPANVGYTSIEIKVNYLRPIHAHTGELIVRGWVTKPGRRVAFAEADVRDADGAVLATATSTCLILGG